MQKEIEKHPADSASTEMIREAKRMGISDARLADLWKMGEGKGAAEKVRHLRIKHGLKPVFKLVDTCAAEFESYTPYLYSAYEEEDDRRRRPRRFTRLQYKLDDEGWTGDRRRHVFVVAADGS